MKRAPLTWMRFSGLSRATWFGDAPEYRPPLDSKGPFSGARFLLKLLRRLPALAYRLLENAMRDDGEVVFLLDPFLRHGLSISVQREAGNFKLIHYPVRPPGTRLGALFF